MRRYLRKIKKYYKYTNRKRWTEFKFTDVEFNFTQFGNIEENVCAASKIRQKLGENK